LQNNLNDLQNLTLIKKKQNKFSNLEIYSSHSFSFFMDFEKFEHINNNYLNINKKFDICNINFNFIQNEKINLNYSSNNYVNKKYYS
jgi:hypothetical protein